MIVIFGLAGCTSLTRSETKLTISDGCLIQLEGVSLTQAKSIIKNWEMLDGCAVRVGQKFLEIPEHSDNEMKND